MDSVKTYIQNEIERVEKNFIASSELLAKTEFELSKIDPPTPIDVKADTFSTVEFVKEFVAVSEKMLGLQQRIYQLKAENQYLNIYHTNLINLFDQLNQSSNKTSKSNMSEDNGFEKVSLVINAQEEERYRLSRQIHDGPAQGLANFILRAEIASRLLDIDVNKARTELKELKAAATKTLKEVRNYIFELRPMMLDDLGLDPTIQQYIQTLNEQNGIPIVYEVTGGNSRFERTIEVMIFRALQELLTNAYKHSEGTIIKVKLIISNNMVNLEVSDNGQELAEDKLSDERNFGMNLLRNRVLEFGGKFNYRSDDVNGTVILIMIPVTEVLIS